jgi:GxxExxY protein
MLTRAMSPLPLETEDLIYRVIGCALTVHTTLGAGYVEAVYRKAMCIELRHHGLGYSTEQTVQIEYRGEAIHGHRVDLLVENLVIVELKAVERLDLIHRAQLVSYLRALRLRVGLLMNFNTDHLKGSIKRVVL